MWDIVNIKPPGYGPRFLSMFPFTRGPHPILDPQPFEHAPNHSRAHGAPGDRMTHSFDPQPMVLDAVALALKGGKAYCQLKPEPRDAMPCPKRGDGAHLAMGQNPNRTPSEHPSDSIPTKIGSKMGGAPTPKRPKIVPLVLTHRKGTTGGSRTKNKIPTCITEVVGSTLSDPTTPDLSHVTRRIAKGTAK